MVQKEENRDREAGVPLDFSLLLFTQETSVYNG